MNKRSQNMPHLSQIYRESSANVAPTSGAWLDIDVLVDAASGHVVAENREKIVAALASSAVEADLYRLLQALQPVSLALTQDLAAQTPTTVVPFKRSQLPRQTLPMARWGWLAVAASVLAAVFVAVPRDFVQESTQTANTVQQRSNAPLEDEIFRAEMGTRVVSNRSDSNATLPHDDTIFRGRFSGS